ncbi:BRO family protein [Rhodomicrobium lacus]|uniref:BRO family protein n=1 Tax=Rhodomicrobium lacus TaxID=2498452 RepID=UPI000F8F7F68|nr:BRO family protein [Rhodomicrobium lacus]
MSAVTAFDFEELPVRVILRDGQPWFILADVCRVLDIANSRDAASRLDEDEKGVGTTDTLGGKQSQITINESGLYSLILTSRKENAKRFKKWVTSEVLPAIRRTGEYRVPATGSDIVMPDDWRYQDANTEDLKICVALLREARYNHGKKAAVELWRRLSPPLPPIDAISKDDVSRFVREVIRSAPGNRVKADALYARYRLWCRENGIEPLTMTALGRRLQTFDFEKRKRTGVYYMNIALS